MLSNIFNNTINLNSSPLVSITLEDATVNSGGSRFGISSLKGSSKSLSFFKVENEEFVRSRMTNESLFHIYDRFDEYPHVIHLKLNMLFHYFVLKCLIARQEKGDLPMNKISKEEEYECAVYLAMFMSAHLMYNTEHMSTKTVEYNRVFMNHFVTSMNKILSDINMESFDRIDLKSKETKLFANIHILWKNAPGNAVKTFLTNLAENVDSVVYALTKTNTYSFDVDTLMSSCIPHLKHIFKINKNGKFMKLTTTSRGSGTSATPEVVGVELKKDYKILDKALTDMLEEKEEKKEVLEGDNYPLLKSLNDSILDKVNKLGANSNFHKRLTSILEDESLNSHNYTHLAYAYMGGFLNGEMITVDHKNWKIPEAYDMCGGCFGGSVVDAVSSQSFSFFEEDGVTFLFVHEKSMLESFIDKSEIEAKLDTNPYILRT